MMLRTAHRSLEAANLTLFALYETLNNTHSSWVIELSEIQEVVYECIMAFYGQQASTNSQSVEATRCLEELDSLFKSDEVSVAQTIPYLSRWLGHTTSLGPG